MPFQPEGDGWEVGWTVCQTFKLEPQQIDPIYYEEWLSELL